MYYTGIKQHKNLEFEQYLKLQGKSFSTIKTPDFFGITDKIILGKFVDALMDNNAAHFDFKHALAPAAKKIYAYLDSTFGEALKLCEKQISYTGQITESGLFLNVKGRPDLKLGNMIIDLKVAHEVKTVKQYLKTIDFMKYDCQLWHYMQLANAKEALILAYFVETGKAEIIKPNFERAPSFWLDALMNFGDAA